MQATEHSVMTAMDPDGEMEQAINIVQNAHDGILSIVIDSYNYKNFLENACLKGHELNEEIINFLNKTEGNKIVFRPDSGEPVLKSLKENSEPKKIPKDSKHSMQTYVFLGRWFRLPKDKGILFGIKKLKDAAENLIFGMGGGLHTAVNRDTQRNTFKCSAQLRNGEWIDIFKKPLDSSKKSRKENSNY